MLPFRKQILSSRQGHNPCPTGFCVNTVKDFIALFALGSLSCLVPGSVHFCACLCSTCAVHSSELEAGGCTRLQPGPWPGDPIPWRGPGQDIVKPLYPTGWRARIIPALLLCPRLHAKVFTSQSHPFVFVTASEKHEEGKSRGLEGPAKGSYHEAGG